MMLLAKIYFEPTFFPNLTFLNDCTYWPILKILAVLKSMPRGAGKNMARTVFVQFRFSAVSDRFYEPNVTLCF